jgi:hypothetical protein
MDEARREKLEKATGHEMLKETIFTTYETREPNPLLRITGRAKHLRLFYQDDLQALIRLVRIGRGARFNGANVGFG